MNAVISNLHNDIYFIQVYQDIYQRFDKDIDKTKEIFNTVIKDCIKKSKNGSIKRFLRNLPSLLDILLKIVSAILSIIIFFANIITPIVFYSKNKLYKKINSFFKNSTIEQSGLNLIEALSITDLDTLLSNGTIKTLLADIVKNFDTIGYDNILQLMSRTKSKDKSSNKQRVENFKIFINDLSTMSQEEFSKKYIDGIGMTQNQLINQIKQEPGIDIDTKKEFFKNISYVSQIIQAMKVFDKGSSTIQAMSVGKNKIKSLLTMRHDERKKDKLIDQKLNDDINSDLLNPISDGLNGKQLKDKKNIVKIKSQQDGKLIKDFRNPNEEEIKNPTFHFKILTEVAQEIIKKENPKLA